jgi:vanillate O-demethylase monooxygenase subunit
VPEPETELFSRTILGESMLLFRSRDGWSAIGNRCPHRFAPLDMGRLVDGTVECGYHGLRFDGTGACVLNPLGSGHVPSTASVASHPVEQRHGVLWVWPGDPEAADPARIPDFSILDDSDTVHATGGYMHCNAGYELVVDNLMDLSHVAFLHASIASHGWADSELTVREEGTVVDANYWAPGIEVSPFFQQHLGSDGLADNWQDMRLHAPSSLLLSYGATRVGNAREAGYRGWASHILTPETETSVHYFFSQGRPRTEGIADVVAREHEFQKQVFLTEDKPMLEACQAMMGDAEFWALEPVLLGFDKAAVRARRVIERMVDAERGS